MSESPSDWVSVSVANEYRNVPLDYDAIVDQCVPHVRIHAGSIARAMRMHGLMTVELFARGVEFQAINEFEILIPNKRRFVFEV